MTQNNSSIDSLLKWINLSSDEKIGIFDWGGYGKLVDTYRLKEKIAEKWEYKDKKFTPKASAGFTSADAIKYSCEFMRGDKNTCFSKLNSCVSGVGTDTDFCKNLVDMDYRPMSEVGTAEFVSKLDGFAAFEILRKFNFSKSDSNAVVMGWSNVNNVRIYKVESLNSWIRKFMEERRNGCSNIGTSLKNQCGSIHSVLGKDISDKLAKMMVGEDSGKGFLKFLALLIERVNASPEIMNNEVVFNPSIKHSGMKPDARLSVKFHLDPNGKIRNKINRSRYVLNSLGELIDTFVPNRSHINDNYRLADMVNNNNYNYSYNGVPTPLMGWAPGQVVYGKPNIIAYGGSDKAAADDPDALIIDAVRKNEASEILAAIFLQLGEIMNEIQIINISPATHKVISNKITHISKNHQDMVKLLNTYKTQMDSKLSSGVVPEKSKTIKNLCLHINTKKMSCSNQCRKIVKLLETVAMSMRDVIKNMKVHPQSGGARSAKSAEFDGTHTQSIIAIPKSYGEVDSDCMRTVNYDVVEIKKPLKTKVNKVKYVDIHQPGTIFIDTDRYDYHTLTNECVTPFAVDGTEFLTAEHYYQWQKFADNMIKAKIVNADTARKAKHIARINKHLAKNNFDKYSAMVDSVTKKINSNPRIAAELKRTGNSNIVLHRLNSNLWGDGGNGTGLNLLGTILVDVRKTL